MSPAPVGTGDEVLRAALRTLTDLDRLRHVDQPLLAAAAARGHAALARALSNLAPDDCDAVP